MFEKLSKKIIKWAKDRDLIHRKNAPKQFLKCIEEIFEFKSEMDQVERVEHEKLKEIYTENMKIEMGDIWIKINWHSTGF